MVSLFPLTIESSTASPVIVVSEKLSTPDSLSPASLSAVSAAVSCGASVVSACAGAAVHALEKSARAKTLIRIRESVLFLFLDFACFIVYHSSFHTARCKTGRKTQALSRSYIARSGDSVCSMLRALFSIIRNARDGFRDYITFPPTRSSPA
jgi:hypothetical protein